MNNFLDTEDDLNNSLDENTKNRIKLINKDLTHNELKYLKLDEFSKIKYSLPPFDFSKITRSELNKLRLLMQNQKEYVELMRGLIKHGETLNKHLLKSVECVDKIKRNLWNNQTDDSSSNQELFLATLSQRFSCMEKILNDIKDNLFNRSDSIEMKKEKLKNLEDMFEIRNEIFMKKMYKYIQRKYETNQLKDIEMSLQQNRTLHESSVYDIVCENMEKEVYTKLEKFALLETNLKSMINKKLNEKYGISFENFNHFAKTKIDSMNQEIIDILFKFKQCLKELIAEKEHNLINLSRKTNILETKLVGIDADINDINEEIFNLSEKKKMLSDMKVKFEKFLDIGVSEDDEIISKCKGNLLADLSIDTSYSMIYLSMIEDSKRILFY
ncbi:Hypothetical protein SRAE_2000287000 [Strongyloides ratti]|uniref:Uncharacterized protein n=1 Tax=Strongyloides ratti TaxID=34506 RepID=A0A090LEQ7_STRRB|nr:Hypothetical protein SRAE_2000287000 [Strongyloides ratti]CEF68212.2 Hypothetical protein SRAE_2000287000 [Strongyloides ratti]